MKKNSIVHSFAEDECTAFIEFINTKLGDDPMVSYLLPLTEISALFEAMSDGVLLCRLINLAVAETIDERVINVRRSHRFLYP